MSARGARLPTLVLAVVGLLVLAPVADVPGIGPERLAASGATSPSEPLSLTDPGDDVWIDRVAADANGSGGVTQAGSADTSTSARTRGERTTTRGGDALDRQDSGDGAAKGSVSDDDRRSAAVAAALRAETGATLDGDEVASEGRRDAASQIGNESGEATGNASAGENGTAPAGNGSSGADQSTLSGGNGSAVDGVGAAAVHDRGVTGEGVRIGVVGSAFDDLPPSVANRVDAREQVAPGAAGSHGAAVAEVASRTAPNASLYLVGVGDSPTPGTYEEAVGWLVDREVDVIVDAGSYFPRTVDGRDRIADAAAAAADHGAVFVTSAGNYADRHWIGPGPEAGWAQFTSDSEVAFLADGERIQGRVSLRLRWNSTNDHDLYLYRQLPGADAVVARSTRRHDDNRTRRAEAIDVAVPRGRYYVAIRSAAGEADPGRVRLFSPRVPIQHATGAGALAPPAGADGVVPVAAGNASGELTSYSSAGGERAAVDVVAPGVARTAAAGRFEGTSAAAPYAGGVAALLAAENGNLTPGVVGQVLRNVSRERGRLDALHAWAAVSPNASLGVEETGIRVAANGTVVNTTAPNGTTTNETAANGTAVNRTASNGTAVNRTAANVTATNETAANGNAANQTAANDSSATGTAASRADAVASRSPTELLLGFVRDHVPGGDRRIAGVARLDSRRPVFVPVAVN